MHIDNFRCIIFRPCLGKCLGKLYITRLNHFLRKSHVLSHGEYGFTPQRSAEDALVRPCDTVQQGKRKNLVMLLIFLDITGAFDNAWWHGILK